MSLLSDLLPARSTDAYRAYRSIDSTTSPVDLAVELMYYNLYELAIGIQMAGPNLTPESFGQGMRAYKPAKPVGPAGSWLWPQGEFTAPADGRVVWWDPTTTSVYNGQLGSYASTGERFPIGEIPAKEVHVELKP